MGFYDNQPGYQNPLGKDAPSWNKPTDWQAGSGGINWSGGFSRDQEENKPSRTSWYDAVKKDLFDKSRDSRKSGGMQPFGGEWSKTGAGQVLDNLGVVYPQQHSPMFIPGQEGEKGPLSTIAGIAAPIVGMMGGPTAPFIAAGLGGLGSTNW